MTSTRAPKGRHRDQADRRAVIDVLLARLARGIAPTAAEAAMLAEHVREEQRLADENRKAMAGTTQALERHRAAADAAIRELEQRAEKAEHRINLLTAVDEGRAHGTRRIMDERDQAQQRAQQAEAEVEQHKADYLSACGTIARMHAAATGYDDRGPERGVVEDVTDVRARMLAAEQRAAQAEESLRAAHQCSNDAEQARAEAAQLSHRYRNRAEQAEQRLARLRDMADAWERRLPATIRTATAAEAVRNAANGDDRPVMFGTTPVPADDEQPTEQDQAEAVADNERQRADWNASVAAMQQQRAETAEARLDEQRRRADHRGAQLAHALDRVHRYRTAWMACRRDRKADRAAMAADLPAVEAVDRVRALADRWERYGIDALKHYAGILRAEIDQPAKTPLIAVGPARRAPEVITDRATIRAALDEPAPVAQCHAEQRPNYDLCPCNGACHQCDDSPCDACAPARP